MRDQRRDDGFTLVEVMVVLMVISILVAVAVPTLLGARSRTSDRAAQSLARNGLSAAFVVYADDRRFSDDPNVLSEVEPTLDYVTDLATLGSGASEVFVDTADAASTADTMVLAARSSQGECFWIRWSAPTSVARYARNDCGAAPAAGDWAARWS